MAVPRGRVVLGDHGAVLLPGLAAVVGGGAADLHEERRSDLLLEIPSRGSRGIIDVKPAAHLEDQAIEGLDRAFDNGRGFHEGNDGAQRPEIAVAANQIRLVRVPDAELGGDAPAGRP
jgi:hypothetical protein